MTLARDPHPMPPVRSDWDAWRGQLWRPPIRREELGLRLRALAPLIRARLRSERSLSEEWAPVGVEVAHVAMAARGSFSPRSGSRAIFVNAHDAHPLQRFTVAHELAHLLLAAPQRNVHVLEPDEEESLCDDFARTLLVPLESIPEHVRAYPTPDEIVRLCGRLRVNVRPVLRQVGDVLGRSRHHLLLARWRGHRRRPAERDFRIEDAAGNPHVFLPFDERLLSTGLATLAARARDAQHGETFEGVDDDVVVRLRGLQGSRSSAVSYGRVRWRAQRQGRDRPPYVLVVLDLLEVLPPELRDARPRLRRAS